MGWKVNIAIYLAEKKISRMRLQSQKIHKSYLFKIRRIHGSLTLRFSPYSYTVVFLKSQKGVPVSKKINNRGVF